MKGPFNCVLGLLALALAGCTGANNIAPVSGRVTLNGKPLQDASVSFQPLNKNVTERPAASGSFGRTDADGKFALRLIEPDQPGALVGKHKVTISTATAAGGDGAAPKGELVPKAWRDGSRQFEVPAGGTTAADFELKGP